MEKLVINGPTRLKGDVNISGAKNAAVAIIPATLLIDGECTLENVPNISDVKLSCTILEKLGAKITWLTENSLKIDTRKITSTRAPLDITSKFRASYYLIGSLLSRCGKAEVGLPGGCKLGARPIDQHIKGFEALGAKCYVINNEPNGLNINNNAGSTHIEGLQKYVVDNGLDVGFAYDGDADRCLCVDELGNVITGDHILYIYGKYMKERGKLDNNTVVTTVMSNFGLYKALDELGIGYAKTAVGDKYVYEYMQQNGCRIGDV